MIAFYKNQGETPLQALNRLRVEKPELVTETLSYAGRLDPMAEGLLLVLVGADENKRRQEFLGLDKTYEVEIVFGIESDTYDALGLVKEEGIGKEISLLALEAALKNIQGEFLQSYPPYSSKPLNGKPLFEWAKEGKVKKEDIPTKIVSIKNAESISIFFKSIQEVKDEALEMIRNVKGDFRQLHIIESWEQLARSCGELKVMCCKVKIECSSGTYMRSVAHELGKSFGQAAIALKIKRIRIGTSGIAI